jgi:hypothetical protein
MVTIGMLLWSSTRQAVRPQVDLAKRKAPPAESPNPLANPSAEFTELLTRVDALQSEIQATLKQAELLDARQQADQMIVIYTRW